MEMEKLLSEIEHWPVDERIEFVQKVWDRIVKSGETPTLTADQKTELDRRLDVLHQYPHQVMAWDEIVSYVRSPKKRNS